MHGYENVHGAIERNMKMKFKNELKNVFHILVSNIIEGLI